MICQLGCFRRQPGSNERAPIMCRYHDLPVCLKILHPHIKYEFGQWLEHIVRPVVRQTIRATIARQIDRDEDVIVS